MHSTLHPLSMRRLEHLRVVDSLVWQQKESERGRERKIGRKIHTLPAYPMCTAPGAGAGRWFKGWVHTAAKPHEKPAEHDRKYQAIRSCPRQWTEIVFSPPCQSTKRSKNPTLFYTIRGVFVCSIHVPFYLGRERERIAHVPAPRTLRPPQHIPGPKPRGLLDSQATTACCLVPFR